MHARTPRALVIAHEPDGPARQVEVRLVERGFAVDTHVVTHDYQSPGEFAPWPDLGDYDVVLPMGSIRNLPNKEPIEGWIHDELRLLREAHDRGQPILGVCFGGQLMAEALGGTVETAPVTEIGWYVLRAPEGAVNPAGPGPWMEWHHDRFTPPAEAQVLAETDDAIQLFRLGKTVGTQFHPEVDIAHLSGWLETCEDEYLEAHGTTREKILADITQYEQHNIEQCRAFVDWWLDEVAFPDGLPAAAAPQEVSA